MRIVVQQFEQADSASVCSVVFRSSIGQGKGIWMSRHARPNAGHWCDVEFTFLESIQLGRNASLSEPGRYAMCTTDGVVEMQGFVDGQDDDGLVYFRLATDCLSMIDCDDERVRPGDWLQLTVPVPALLIYPLGG